MGGLFKKPRMPKPEKPQRMTDEIDEQRKKQNEMQKVAQRSRIQGRGSTDKGGGGDLTGAVLGG